MIHDRCTSQNGQVLTTVLVVMSIGIIFMSVAVAAVISNTQESVGYYQGMYAAQLAESGVENALLRLLRDPLYTGETLTIGSDQVVVTVTGTSPKIIRSVGSVESYQRILEVTVTQESGVLDTTAWREVYQ